jgi:hypothetical protein
VDGCGKLCAKKAIAKYSKEPVDSLNVESLLREWAVEPPENRRVLSEVDLENAKKISRRLIQKVKEIQEAA